MALAICVRYPSHLHFAFHDTFSGFTFSGGGQPGVRIQEVGIGSADIGDEQAVSLVGKDSIAVGTVCAAKI